MKKVAKKLGLLTAALWNVMTTNLEAVVAITPVAGCPTQQQYDAAFAAMQRFYKETGTVKQTYLNITEPDLVNIRRNQLNIPDGAVYKTLECCRQQISNDDLKDKRTKILCGKLEVKGISVIRASGISYSTTDPRPVAYPPAGSAKPVPFNFPQAGDITSTNAIDVAKNNHTLVDFFTKNAGMSSTKWALGEISNIDADTKSKLPQEKFRLLPENFIRFVFYPHRGLRAELMAHFIAPFATGNDWDLWKRWGERFNFLTENEQEIRSLVGTALVNLVKKNDPQAIIELYNAHTNLLSQMTEVINSWWDESVGPTSRKNRVKQIASGRDAECWHWWDDQLFGNFLDIKTETGYRVGLPVIHRLCSSRVAGYGGLQEHETRFLQEVSRESSEWFQRFSSIKAAKTWNSDSAKNLAIQKGWRTGSDLQKQALETLWRSQ